MDNIESAIVSYQLYLKDVMYDKRSCKHTHPPITTQAANCLYCNKYGNVFANGTELGPAGLLSTYIVPFRNG